MGKENMTQNLNLSSQPLITTTTTITTEKQSQAMRLHRELEDIIDSKDVIIAEKDKEIQKLQEMVEKVQYESEARKQIEEGKFTHTKILMSTLDELNKTNETLSNEV